MLVARRGAADFPLEYSRQVMVWFRFGQKLRFAAHPAKTPCSATQSTLVLAIESFPGSLIGIGMEMAG